MISRIAISLALAIVVSSYKQAPAGKYIYVQPPPAIIEFGENEIRFLPVGFPNDSPSRGIEVKPGVVVPYGSAEELSKSKKELDVMHHIQLRAGDLFYDDSRIDFNGLHVYKIREAYRWGKWIVCDGYTSASDRLLNVPSEKREGLLPSEVVYFDLERRVGKTKPFGMAPLSIQIIGGRTPTNVRRQK